MADGDVVSGEDRLLLPSEVAQIFRISPKTVTRWADQGLIPAVRANPRAHRRYRESDVRALIKGGTDGDGN